MDFVEKIYKLTAKFPHEEIYGLTAQLRRAVISISLNIAEGSGARSDNEFGRFLIIAHRSNYEVMCGIEIAKRLKYINVDEVDGFLKESNELSAMIFGLQKKLKADS